MRVLAFSDLHCDRDAAQHVVHESASADVVLGAGDPNYSSETLTQSWSKRSKNAQPLITAALKNIG